MIEGNSRIASIHDERVPEGVLEKYSLSVRTESLVLRQLSKSRNCLSHTPLLDRSSLQSAGS